MLIDQGMDWFYVRPLDDCYAGFRTTVQLFHPYHFHYEGGATGRHRVAKDVHNSAVVDSEVADGTKRAHAGRRKISLVFVLLTTSYSSRVYH